MRNKLVLLMALLMTTALGAQPFDLVPQPASVQYGDPHGGCILDKDVVIGEGVRLIGTPEHPVILKRGESA